MELNLLSDCLRVKAGLFFKLASDYLQTTTQDRRYQYRKWCRLN